MGKTKRKSMAILWMDQARRWKLAVKPDPSKKPDGDYIKEIDEYSEGAVCWVKERWA